MLICNLKTILWFKDSFLGLYASPCWSPSSKAFSLFTPRFWFLTSHRYHKSNRFKKREADRSLNYFAKIPLLDTIPAAPGRIESPWFQIMPVIAVIVTSRRNNGSILAVTFGSFFSFLLSLFCWFFKLLFTFEVRSNSFGFGASSGVPDCSVDSDGGEWLLAIVFGTGFNCLLHVLQSCNLETKQSQGTVSSMTTNNSSTCTTY